ncbi:MAG: hypothetical protein ABSF65_02140 [Candidatus Bathyarchaeia archaeon]|jgi:hypothetical protein
MTSDDDKLKPVSSPGMALPNVIFEQVNDPTNGSHYLVYDRIEKQFLIKKDVWRTYSLDVEYCPLTRLTWPSVTGYVEFKTTEELYHEIRAFFVEHLDVANELFYDVYTCFVLASWRPEDFKVIPYLFFLGPLSSGKTRALECLHRLCYRSIMSSSISAAAVFRVLEAWHPTLLLDETEIYNRDCMIEVLALLNSGYRKGQYAIRIEKEKEGCPQIGVFDTFGFKILAGTEELAATLQSRCIITAMSRAVKQVNLFIDEEKAQELRNKLLQYRFKNLGNIDLSSLPEFAKNNGFFRNARVIELFISLFEVAPNEEIKKRLELCMKQITQSRFDEEQASIEARVFDAVFRSEDKAENGKISTQDITEVFNQGLTENDQATSRFVGRKVAALGFEKCRVGHKGQSGFYYDKKLLERLKSRYDPKTTSETSETSETTASMEKQGLIEDSSKSNAEVTEVNSSVSENGKTTNFPLNAEVSEETEVTEVKLEGSRKVILAKRIKPMPGQSCQAEGHGEPCILEATYEIDGNLYCDKHFLKSKKVCLDNGYSVELAPVEEGS